MNSFNHYAYGAIGDWMYSMVAGIQIDPAAPAYKHSLIEPHPGGGLTRAAGSHLTPYGRLSSEWELNRGNFQLTVEVPPNTSATVKMPQAQLAGVMEAGKPLSGLAGDAHQEGNAVLVTIGSGHYHFTYRIDSVRMPGSLSSYQTAQ